MHNLRINISDHPKIVINSPEVCLGTTRQNAQVGHKNINIFSYKNSFMQSLQKWKTIYIKRFTT
jgi:hypothetical protein